MNSFDRLSYLSEFLTLKFNPEDEFSDAALFARSENLVKQYTAGIFFGMELAPDFSELHKLGAIVDAKKKKLPRPQYGNRSTYGQTKLEGEYAFWNGVKAWGMVLTTEDESNG